MKEKKNILRKFFIPNYSIIFLFLAAYLFILSLVFEIGLFKEISSLFKEENLALAIFFFVFIAGLILSIYYTFSSNSPKVFSKYLMLFFIIVFEVVIGIESGFYLLENSYKIFIIFPLLNIINALTLYLLFRMGKIDDSSISDKKVKNPEIIVGLISMSILFFINKFFGVYWTVNLSVCLGYAYKMNEFVTNLVWKVQNN